MPSCAQYRRPVVLSQPKKPRIPKVPRSIIDLLASEEHRTLARLPINVPERPDEIAEEDDQERGTSSGSEVESLHTPAPSSSIS